MELGQALALIPGLWNAENIVGPGAHLYRIKLGLVNVWNRLPDLDPYLCFLWQARVERLLLWPDNVLPEVHDSKQYTS